MMRAGLACYDALSYRLFATTSITGSYAVPVGVRVGLLINDSAFVDKQCTRIDGWNSS